MTNSVSGGKSPKRKVGAKGGIVGRPRSVEPDEATLKLIRALGQIDATEEEMAAVLGVSPSTFREAKKRSPEIAEMIERARAEGRVSLRRSLRRMAERNPAAAIFLSKNKLGMTDRVEQTNKGEIAISIDAEDAKL